MDVTQVIKELSYKAIRSSGAGGQHVNKVSSKVELTFDLKNSKEFSLEQKERLLNKLANKINKEGKLILFCGESRSQHKNKEIVTNRFIEIIQAGLKVPKIRKATKPSKTSILKKAEHKKKLSHKKNLRRKPTIE